MWQKIKQRPEQKETPFSWNALSEQNITSLSLIPSPSSITSLPEQLSEAVPSEHTKENDAVITARLQIRHLRQPYD